MAKVTFSNHAALRVRPGERERIRKLYGDILGCTLNRQLEEKDDFRIGDDYYISFLYGGPGGKEPDKGAVYVQSEALSDDDFLKAIYLELKTDDVQGMRQRITDFGVNVLPVPDPHLYFQAPGGQVFRLVGTDEDLSKYEGEPLT